MHAGLYLFLLVQAISGYVRVTTGGFPIETLEALGIPPLLPKAEGVGEIASTVHLVSAICLMVLIAMHVERGGVSWAGQAGRGLLDDVAADRAEAAEGTPLPETLVVHMELSGRMECICAMRRASAQRCCAAVGYTILVGKPREDTLPFDRLGRRHLAKNDMAQRLSRNRALRRCRPWWGRLAYGALLRSSARLRAPVAKMKTNRGATYEKETVTLDGTRVRGLHLHALPTGVFRARHRRAERMPAPRTAPFTSKVQPEMRWRSSTPSRAIRGSGAPCHTFSRTSNGAGASTDVVPVIIIGVE